MKQRLLILMGVIVLVAALVGLNAASYTQKEKAPDSEAQPNRSSYNSGATGTQAWFSLLAETGRKATRWQEPPAALLTTKNAPNIFVIAGTVRRPFADSEIEELLRWTSQGGRLVIVDRYPSPGLVTTTANWQIAFAEPVSYASHSTDPSDLAKMTRETPAIKPVQPSLWTYSVNAIQPSVFAAGITLDKFDTPSEAAPKTKRNDNSEDDAPPPPMARTDASGGTTDNGSESQIAPVVYFVSSNKNVLVEVPFGMGKIVYLADPYIVSNAGIGLADNSQLAMNLVAGTNAVVAFDEYHQGFGGGDNAFLKFFEGTPVVAIFFQALLLVGLVFYSQSRRFARPVPEPEPDRLSKLEYVSAMAELQQRARAYDLAIENIYGEFRRRAARLLGADNFTVKYDELARLIAERTGLDARGVSETLFKCEDIIRGEPTSKREVVELIANIRQLEQKLNLSRSARQK